MHLCSKQSTLFAECRWEVVLFRNSSQLGFCIKLLLWAVRSLFTSFLCPSHRILFVAKVYHRKAIALSLGIAALRKGKNEFCLCVSPLLAHPFRAESKRYFPFPKSPRASHCASQCGTLHYRPHYYPSIIICTDFQLAASSKPEILGLVSSGTVIGGRGDTLTCRQMNTISDERSANLIKRATREQ